MKKNLLIGVSLLLPVSQICSTSNTRMDFKTSAETHKPIIIKTDKINNLDRWGWHLLHYAAQENNIEVAKELLRQGADINVKKDIQIDGSALESTGKGETPLHEAVFSTNEKFAKFLIEQKVDIEARDYAFRTPLHFACWIDGYTQIIQQLLENGANPNAQDKWGWTPLHRIVFASPENKEAIQLLFSHGARDDIKNMSGKTASDIAFEHHQFELSTLKSQKKL